MSVMTKQNAMPSICLRLGLFLALASYLGCSTASDGQTLTIISQSNDMGRVMKEGGYVSADVVVKNTGDKDLQIDSVKPTCSCMSSVFSKTLLRPGEIARITVALRPETEKGRKAYSLFLLSNDQHQRIRRIEMKADVVEVFRANPDHVYLDIQTLTPGSNIARQVAIENVSSSRVDRFSIVSQSPFVTVHASNDVDSLPPGQIAVATVCVDESLLPGRNLMTSVKLQGVVDGQMVTRMIDVLVARDGKTNEVEAVQLRGVDTAPTHLSYLLSTNGWMPRSQRVRMVLSGPVTELDVTPTSPHLRVVAIPPATNSAGQNREYEVSIDDRFVPKRKEYSVLRISGIVGGERVSKLLPVSMDKVPSPNVFSAR